jgi:hypothetical protein
VLLKRNPPGQPLSTVKKQGTALRLLCGLGLDCLLDLLDLLGGTVRDSLAYRAWSIGIVPGRAWTSILLGAHEPARSQRGCSAPFHQGLMFAERVETRPHDTPCLGLMTPAGRDNSWCACCHLTPSISPFELLSRLDARGVIEEYVSNIIINPH